MRRDSRWRPTTKANGYPSAVQAIAARLAPAARRRFLAAIKKMADDAGTAAVEAAIRDRNTAELVRLFDVSGLTRRMDAALATVNQAFGMAGVVAYEGVASAVGLAGAFNVRNPRAAALIKNQGALLIQGLTASARGVIRDLVASGYETGRTPAQTARLIRKSIGLTERQANAVDNYLLRLFEDGKAVDAAVRSAERYATQLLNYRAKMISVQETQNAVHTGQREAWQQAADKKLFDPADTEKVWACDPDACPQCSPLDGEAVPFDEQFSAGVDGPPLHIFCRCNQSLRFGTGA